MTDKLLQALSQFGLQNTLLHSLSSQAAEEGSPLDALLLERGLLNEENLLEALAAATELKPVNLNHFYPDFSLAKLLLPEWCQQHCCVPLCEEDEALHVAVGYPPRLEALEAFSLRVGRKLLPWIAIECRIQQWLAALYGLPISQHTFALLEKLSQNPLPPPPASENIPPIPSETLLPPNEETLPPPTTSTPPLPPEVNPAPMPTAARENTAAQSHRAPPFKEPRPVAQASNVFRDFFVKVKQQLWPKRETPPPNLTPPLTLPPLPPIEPPLPPAPLPAFSAVDEGPFGQNLFEEFFANIPTPLPRLEKSTLTPPVENVPVPPEENASTPPEENASVPPVENASAPPEENASTPPERNALVPPVENASAPPERNALVPPEENASVPPEENASVPLPITLVENTPLPPPTLVENTSTPPVENIPAPPEENIPPPPPAENAPVPPAENAPHHPLPQPISFQNNTEAPPPNWTLEEAQQQLRLAQKNRDSLTSVLLRFGLRSFEFVGLFSVIQGKAQGFSCAGKGAQEGFLRTKIELSSSGIFHSVSQTASAYFGPPPQEPILQRLLSDIQRRPRSVFIYPIAVGDKLVAIFYGDSSQTSLQQKQFADFTLFCQKLPAAFHELLWVRRKQTLPTSPLDETALKERIAHAISQLFETDAATQNTALEILAQTPQASAHTLIQLFPGPHSSLLLEDESLPPLHTLGPIPHALLQLGNAGALALKPLLSSENKQLRCAALKLAAAFASPPLLEPVTLALSDTDSQVASTARAVLPHFKTLDEWPLALSLIQNSLHVKDPLRRTSAAKAVVAAKDRGSIQTLIQWTGDADAWVAETAAWALQKLSCIQLGPSPSLWQRWWSRAQYERRVQWLVCALESESFEQRKQAIEELSSAIGDSFHFRAEASEEERWLAVQCWQQFVAQNPLFDV